VLTLILGGARSGKSDLAQRLAAASGRDVLFVATMQPGDDELRLRVEQHRAGRPPSWRTIEATHDVEAALEQHARPGECVVIDCMTMWVSNLLIERLGDGDDVPAEAALAAIDDMAARARAFAGQAAPFDGDVVVVSNEAGMGVVPAYPLGRAFRDALGAANSAVAARADRVYWLAAGLALELKSLGGLPLEAFGEGHQQ
jgi:adenosylcobinamide kinase/adenosylcobinamide-phosphate guanylyltransferase